SLPLMLSFVWRRRPPRSALLPYTTLFRSGRPQVVAPVLARTDDRVVDEARRRDGAQRVAVLGRVVPQPEGEGQAVADHRAAQVRSEEHTSELQSRENLVCRLLLEKKKKDV